jgi:hypothetical protein
VDTVEVVDPTHPLYSRTLPLVGVTTNKDLGRAAIVRIRPGVPTKPAPSFVTTERDYRNPLAPVPRELTTCSVRSRCRPAC